MARIAGVNLPNKPTWIALTYIHGIGRTAAKKICEVTGVNSAIRIDSLSEDEFYVVLRCLALCQLNSEIQISKELLAQVHQRYH